MNILLFTLILTSTASAFTLNNNFGASFKNKNVSVSVASNTTCATAGITVYELADLVKPATRDFWNTVPTSSLRLKASGIGDNIGNINGGRLCAPTDSSCITSAGGNLIPPVSDIVIACNNAIENFPDAPGGGPSGVLAITIPNNFSGKKIRGAVILINDRTNNFSNLSYNDKVSVIAHEIGHAIGLGHAEEKNNESLMYYKVINLRRSLAQDDVDGVSYLYPVHFDGCGVFGTLNDKNGTKPKGPSHWQMFLSLALMIALAEMVRLLKGPKARPAT